MAKIEVKGTDITVISQNEEDYISLTDMVKNIENGLALIEKWLRNKILSNFWVFGRKCIMKILIPPNSRELKIRPD
jgi:hypothetical protein